MCAPEVRLTGWMHTVIMFSKRTDNLRHVTPRYGLNTQQHALCNSVKDVYNESLEPIIGCDCPYCYNSP